MLKKLIKYDLAWISKNIVIFVALSLIVSILTRIGSNFTDSYIGNIVYLILKGCAIALIIQPIVNAAIRIWVRFGLTVYKDESYLIHTLPVTRATLYSSKVISAIIIMTATLLASLISYLIAFAEPEMLDKLKDIFANGAIVYVFVAIILCVVLEAIYAILCGFVGMLFGHRSNNGKIVKSIVIGMGIYFGIQTLMMGVIAACGLFNPDTQSLYSETINPNLNIETAAKYMVTVSTLCYTAADIGLYFTGKALLKKGVNVD